MTGEMTASNDQTGACSYEVFILNNIFEPFTIFEDIVGESDTFANSNNIKVIVEVVQFKLMLACCRGSALFSVTSPASETG